MHLILPGRVPSKKNSKRIVMAGGRPRLISSEAYLAWHEEMMLRIRAHRPQKAISKAAVAITVYAANRRRFDLSNAAESVMDLLVDAGFLEDDAAANVPFLSLAYGGYGTDARAEVEITPLP